MQTTSRVRKSNVVIGSWRGTPDRHSLLLQMAQDAAKLEGQANRLRALKKAAGRRVTFRKIANACDVSERQVQRWFRGESDPEPDNLKALAEFMGTTPGYIEYGTLPNAKRGRTPDLAATLNGGQRHSDPVIRIEQKIDALIFALLQSGLITLASEDGTAGESGSDEDDQSEAA